MNGYILAGVAALICVILLIRNERQKKTNMEILQMVLGVAEVGDPTLDGHSLNVYYLSRVIYDFLPGDYKIRLSREKLLYAALLMDLGKYSIPAAIRNKKGKLSDEEWKLMRRYPELGVYAMKNVPALKSIENWVLYQREHVDGSGVYHLKGNEIPLASRILAVADTYSAITMVRPYRPSLPYEEAISELRLVAGSRLDQELVNIFCDIPPKRINECIDAARSKMESYMQEQVIKEHMGDEK